MKAESPLISIIIDNYNYAPYLRAAINSALEQTYLNIEVIVVDDGSTDDSRDIMLSFGCRIISVIKENGGQTSAFNAGITASRGDWLCLLDSDDLFHSNKVARICELALQYPTAGVIAHDLAYCTSDGDFLEFASPYILKLKLVDDRPLARRGKMSVSLPALSGLSFRRDVIERLSPLPDDIRIGTDNYMKWVCLSLVPVLLVPEFLGKQRIHGTNAGTIAAETDDAASKLRLAKQDAVISFHMKQQFPNLAKLAWKQYGRLIYLLKSSKLHDAPAIEQDIRTHYSVVELTPTCFFYIFAAFTSAFLEETLGHG